MTKAGKKQETPTKITLEELSLWEGKEIGRSDWLSVSQDRIDAFAACTNDAQWIHVDPKQAAESPLGGTIAHGYLTLSLVSSFVAQVLEISDAHLVLNYGLNRVRFPAPVPVNHRLRGCVALTSCHAVQGGVQYELKVTIEIEGSDRPACVAQPIFRAIKSLDA